MSWSVYATGKPKAVSDSINVQSAQSKCQEPEESIRQAAIGVLQASISAQRPDAVLRVKGSGSMSQSYNEETKQWGPPTTNTLNLEVEVVCVLQE